VQSNTRTDEASSAEIGEKHFCIYCNELYVAPPSEDWIQCKGCGKWAHEAESNADSKQFVCELCTENKQTRAQSRRRTTNKNKV
jgi:acetyl-CoA carboxylase beta subunit